MLSTPLNLNIREIHEDDAPILVQFYDSLSPETRHFFQPYPKWDLETMSGVIQRCQAGEELGLVALNGQGIPLAHLFLQNTAAEVPQLGLCLADQWQNKGLGPFLFKVLLDVVAIRLPGKKIGLTVVKENPRAIKVYEKAGFQKVGEVTFRQPDDSWVMEYR